MRWVRIITQFKKLPSAQIAMDDTCEYQVEARKAGAKKSTVATGYKPCKWGWWWFQEQSKAGQQTCFLSTVSPMANLTPIMKIHLSSVFCLLLNRSPPEALNGTPNAQISSFGCCGWLLNAMHCLCRGG